MDVSVFGIDLGKNSCSVVGLDTTGKVVETSSSVIVPR
jgi:transposase